MVANQSYLEDKHGSSTIDFLTVCMAKVDLHLSSCQVLKISLSVKISGANILDVAFPCVTMVK